MRGLQQVIDILGSQAELARRLSVYLPGDRKIGTGHIYHWMRKRVPAEYVLHICYFVDWQVLPHDLRPDLYPPRTWRPPAGWLPRIIGEGAAA